MSYVTKNCDKIRNSVFKGTVYRVLKSYLSNVKQRNSVSDSYATETEILFRVPYGPILGQIFPRKLPSC